MQNRNRRCISKPLLRSQCQSNTKTSKDAAKKGQLQPNLPHEHRCKVLYKILISRIQVYNKKIKLALSPRGRDGSAHISQ